MAQKINPITHRLGVTIPWVSRWFWKKSTRYFIEEDHDIRKFIEKKILQAGIAGIAIERMGDAIRVTIQASKPGLIIGRGGKGIEELKTGLATAIAKLRKKNSVKPKFSLNLTIEELKRSEISAPVVAQNIAFDIEKRQPYRRIMKRYLESVMQNREVKGAKIKLSGRLNGAEISRRDFLANGSMPLQTLRANVDYGTATAFNSYGTVGVKVWIYKGEIFKNSKKS
ncbi:MAG: 30S ribosomal protein S3 [Candidatus Jorgensenbacteria bacterium]|nr:30S ribosomal protein S3 [Candidatus Jorgensenbacteria bacterium]